MYIYICMYIHMYIYAYICTYTYIYIYIYIYICMYIYVYMDVYVYMYIYMYIYWALHVYIMVNMHLNKKVNVYTYKKRERVREGGRERESAKKWKMYTHFKEGKISRFSPYEGPYMILFISGARGVMIIVIGNGHGYTSSNPERDW